MEEFKSNTPPWVLFSFFSIVQMVPNRATHHIIIDLAVTYSILISFNIWQSLTAFRGFLANSGPRACQKYPLS